MADDSTLINLLFGKPKEAAKDISLKKKYDKMAQRMQAQGKTPPSFEEWKRQRRSD